MISVALGIPGTNSYKSNGTLFPGYSLYNNKVALVTLKYKNQDPQPHNYGIRLNEVIIKSYYSIMKMNKKIYCAD